MNLKKLLDFRPKEATAEALAETRRRLENELVGLDERLTALRAQRGDVLLDSSPDRVSEFERELAATEGERERVAAMHDALCAREEKARSDEQRAGLERAVTDVNKQIRDWCAWYRQVYVPAARAIEEGLVRERALRAAHSTVYEKAFGSDGLHMRLEELPIRQLLPGSSMAGTLIGDMVRLAPSDWASDRDPAPSWPLPEETSNPPAHPRITKALF